ncbi:MAG: prepilin-type N-terminal cleavage/methylation domain-containing protein [Marinisporobacter sp.]|jgi:prepilin-type N-terminal cleavage/methylation domain-containing protein|nr:prepilin-type N-terminal cleavage/methylation domain-containing protein [Marinisporobacter sp.]
MNTIKKNNGFTLIELILVVGIIGIILSAIFSFFLSNYKTFYRSDKQIEAQNIAQMTMDTIVKNVIDTESVYEAVDIDNADMINNDLKDTKKIILIKEYEASIENETTIELVEVAYDDNKLKLRSKTENIQADKDKKTAIDQIKTNMESVDFRDIATYVSAFKIKLIGATTDQSKDYPACKGILIQLSITIDDITVEAENQVYFRNWKP